MIFLKCGIFASMMLTWIGVQLADLEHAVDAARVREARLSDTTQRVLALAERQAGPHTVRDSC